MKRNAKCFFTFFFAQAVSYGTFCWNYRAIAQARYVNIFMSDMACAAISYSLIKKIAESKSGWERAGYILGGACGSLVSVWVTKEVFGQ